MIAKVPLTFFGLFLSHWILKSVDIADACHKLVHEAGPLIVLDLIDKVNCVIVRERPR